MLAVGIELMLSTICINATYCPAIYENPQRASDASAKDLRQKKLADELNGKHLRIGTIENYPLSWVERDKNGKLLGRGVAFEFVEMLREKFNFTYEVVVPANNWEGASNRLESSLLGLVNASEVDMAAAFLPHLPDSLKVARFSPWLDEGTWVMMMKRPTESAAGSGLLAPFEEPVWYLILVAVAAYGPCITLMTRLRHRLAAAEDASDAANTSAAEAVDKPIELAPSVWFVYGAFIKQGTTLAPEANSTRVLFATWWLFIILLSSFYTANLTAFLTLSKFTLEIEDPEDLYTKNYRWTAREGGPVEYVVTDPDEALFYLNKMVMLGRGYFRAVTRNNDFLTDVSAGAVLVAEKVSVDHVMYDDYLAKARSGVEEKDRCTFVVTTQRFMTQMRAFAYPRNSTLYHLFDPVLQSMVESGIIKFLVHQELPATKICPLDLQSKERRLRNSDLLMTYALAAVGICAATAIFIGELFVRRCYSVKIRTSKRKRKWQEELATPQSVHRAWGDTSQPPAYESLFGAGSQYQYAAAETRRRRIVNGRDYWLVRTVAGDTRLIPVRTPSALLFQPT